MTLFLDLTRISTRLLRGHPTGIDRVEFAYARHFVMNGARPDVVSTLTSPVGSGAVPARSMRSHLERIERVWERERSDGDDEFYARVRAEIEAPPDLSRTRSPRLSRQARGQTLARALQFPFADIARARWRFRQALRDVAPGAVYYHSSHTQLDRPERFRWTQAHRVRPVFFIHDTIPVDYPEFCSPGSADRHRRRLKTVADLACAVVVNSRTTGEAVRACLSEEGLRVPEITVAPLGVDETFGPERRHRFEPPQAPYFICVGTIEPRKNLLLLLDMWRELAARRGTATPRLVLVGRRGWENENVLDILERSKALAPFVIEIADLSDAGLSALMRGSRGLLAPSRTEGFSLPVAEALSLGVPIVASDIAVHREIAGSGTAQLLSPIDGRGWLATIETAMEPPRRRPGLVSSPTTWECHMRVVDDLLDRIAKGASSAR